MEQHHSALARTNEQLKTRLLRMAPGPGTFPTSIGGLTVTRHDESYFGENCFYDPVIAVLVRGYKHSVIGGREFQYGENHCLVAGVDVPSVNRVTVPAPGEPFLAVALNIDRNLAARLGAEIPPSAVSSGCQEQAVSVAEADPGLLDAFLRLTEIPDKPEQIPVLAPMLIREIHYRILIGPQGGSLRTISTLGTRSNHVARAVTWLREHYRETVHIDDLARRVDMATSTFHRHFRQLTSLSPLQFQKRLRLYEARRLMLAEDMNAAGACLAVGYESPTQFNREYKRLFGEPPHRDLKRLTPPAPYPMPPEY